jgi:tetrahydromethanopterin S-methyltransferase subunit G
MTKKRITEAEYENQLHRLESMEKLSVSRTLNELEEAVNRINERTDPLRDIGFLIKLIKEKVSQHNAQLNQRAGKMRTRAYRNNHIGS